MIEYWELCKYCNTKGRWLGNKKVRYFKTCVGLSKISTYTWGATVFLSAACILHLGFLAIMIYDVPNETVLSAINWLHEFHDILISGLKWIAVKPVFSKCNWCLSIYFLLKNYLCHNKLIKFTIYVVRWKKHASSIS